MAKGRLLVTQCVVDEDLSQSVGKVLLRTARKERQQILFEAE